MNGMYTIMLGQDGKYHCTGKLQDGTERWTENTLDAAVKSMKRFAKTMNGAKIKKRTGITYLREVQVAKSDCVPYDPFGGGT